MYLIFSFTSGATNKSFQVALFYVLLLLCRDLISVIYTTVSLDSGQISSEET